MNSLFGSRLKKILLGGILLAPIASCYAQSSAAPKKAAPSSKASKPVAANPKGATITVDAKMRLGKVPRYLFGQNVETGDPYEIFSMEHSYFAPRTGGGIWDPVKKAPTALGQDAIDNIGPTMYRYPGGDGTHNYDWKKSIGPVADRPDLTFGLDEFMEYCRLSKAEVMMTVSDYTGTAQDAADLVEYLNAPATPAHPWAQKRAQNGHPAPYGVKYFEMGNETDHGNHMMKPFRKFSAQDYTDYFNSYSQKMRAIDPTIKMGALMYTAGVPEDPWNDVVLTGTRGRADFIIIHKYGVGVNSQDQTLTAAPDLMMRACMANAEQFDAMFKGYNEKILRLTGKKLPLALTEYNALFIQKPDDKPLPYRFTLGAALFSSDFLRLLMEPKTNAFNADYWQLTRGYWGIMSAKRGGVGVDKQAAYYLFQLWNKHFGTELVANQVVTPRLNFEGFARVRPAIGNKYQPEVVGTKNLFATSMAKGSATSDYRTEVSSDGTLKASFTNLKSPQYPVLTTLRGKRGQSHVVSFDARSTGDLKGTHMGLGVIDARGWNATRSGIAIEGVEGASEWKHFTAKFGALPDNVGTEVNWRLIPGTEPVTGTLEVKNLKVVTFEPEKFPAYAAVTSASSLSQDGKKLYVMVFNKHHAEAISTTLSLKNFPATQARRWTVTGPALESTNIDQEVVKETESGVKVTVSAGKPLTYRAPAHSMTAWEFTR